MEGESSGLAWGPLCFQKPLLPFVISEMVMAFLASPSSRSALCPTSQPKSPLLGFQEWLLLGKH